MKMDYTPRQSALTDFPGGEVPKRPSVALVVPIRNEKQITAAMVSGLLAQDYIELCEIWVVDGCSTDGTWEELRKLQRKDPRIQVTNNSKMVPAAALNLVLRQTQCDLIMRMDAHAWYAPDTVRRSVDTLLRTGAAGVGPLALTQIAGNLMAKSIAAIHQSCFGIGVAKFRKVGSEGWADSLWGGCYWRHIMEKVGPWSEDCYRTEDNEYNARVRSLGYGVYLDSDIRALYLPRERLTDMWRQYFGNGLGVAQTFFSRRDAVRLRHFMPLFFITAALVLTLSSLAFFSTFGWMMVLFWMLYFGICIWTSLCAFIKYPGAYFLLMPIAFWVLHTSFGLGPLCGLWKILRQSTQVAAASSATRRR